LHLVGLNHNYSLVVLLKTKEGFGDEICEMWV